jgi:hypothetical protein
MLFALRDFDPAYVSSGSILLKKPLIGTRRLRHGNLHPAAEIHWHGRQRESSARSALHPSPAHAQTVAPSFRRVPNSARNALTPRTR